MADTDERHDQYNDARRRFDDLDVEERARFLVEATASTLAHGLLQAGEALADGLEEALRRARKRANPPHEGREPGAAEPETSQRQAPRNGSHDADPDA
jgi:hypothetical protein